MDRFLGRLRRFRRLFILFAVIGPGLITTNAGNDAGAIATYSQAGAEFGFDLIWILVVITFSLAVLNEMAARMGVVTGKGLADLIRERFGVRGTTLAMFLLLIANAVTTTAEFAGIAAALELFHVPRYVTVPLVALGIWLLIVRGSLPPGQRWWIWTCVCGVAFGLFGLWYVPRLKRRRARAAARRPAMSSEEEQPEAAESDQSAPRDSGSNTVSSTETPGRSTRS